MTANKAYTVTETAILVFGLIIVLINQLLLPVSQTASLIFLGITLLFFGLPHGSIDHLVAEKSSGQINLVRFVLVYLAQIAVVAICWYFLPLLSLLFFLLLSAWHFAETDLHLSPQNRGWVVFCSTLLYGAGILGWILLVHPAQTLSYLQDLSPYFNDAVFTGKNWANQHMLVLIFCGSATLFIAAVYSFKQRSFMLIKTALLLLITYFLPLLAAFAFYFGLWHALHALMDIKNHLQISWKKLFVKALPLSLLSVFGLMFFLALISRFHLNLVLLTFIFISALTLPHARVMSNMYHINNKTPDI